MLRYRVNLFNVPLLSTLYEPSSPWPFQVRRVPLQRHEMVKSAIQSARSSGSEQFAGSATRANAASRYPGSAATEPPDASGRNSAQEGPGSSRFGSTPSGTRFRPTDSELKTMYFSRRDADLSGTTCAPQLQTWRSYFALPIFLTGPFLILCLLIGVPLPAQKTQYQEG